MPSLHIALQEGFSNDDVALRVAGREVFRQSKVNTRTQIGLAARHDANVPIGPLSVEISIPTRQLDLAVPLQIRQDTYLGISVTPEGQIRHIVSHEPFGYL
jgi:hypothetical protein